ncbi:beta-ketoacyl-ACP synthase III [Ferrovum sp.]|uniref:beta-ketoacyl-ACP synthase III n=1 Tax=Ferrovum sp. TaxID=2609467 RepID=UPI00261C6237|nr:beta-ketoacyl-ACP synthase III [Ferrovum sp.]
MIYSKLLGTGGYLPEQIVTNDDLAQRVETNDEWIRSRTGIRQRHIRAPGQTTSDLALEAAHRALGAAGSRPEQLDLIIVATTTPDMAFPSTACLLQAKLGANTGAPAFDVQAVCTGFLYALSVADQFIRSGSVRQALVVGAETFTHLLDWKDRNTCVLFGDGAGAVVLGASSTPGLLGTRLHADGRYAGLLSAPGSMSEGQVLGKPTVQMDGGAVFKFAVKVLDQVSREILTEHGLTPAAVDCFIPHQANIRIIEATAHKLGIPPERVVRTVAEQGNTSAASVPLALDHAWRSGQFKPGQLGLLAAVGGGFTWGAGLLQV